MTANLILCSMHNVCSKPPHSIAAITETQTYLPNKNVIVTKKCIL